MVHQMTLMGKAGEVPIKVIPREEVLRHKIREIMGFVKAGNLPMVKALVEEHRLGMSIILLKGCLDQFAISSTE